MKLQKLELKDFRSYRSAELMLPDGITVISGMNAQGKTNLLESVFLCCTARSHRAKRDEELIRIGADEARIKAAFQSGNVGHTAEIALVRRGKKSIMLDGSRVKRSADFVGKLRSVLFSPDNILIVKDVPQRRRAFMDMAISQVYPGYLGALIDYNRALLQRNAMLKNGVSGGSVMDIYEDEMADAGARVTDGRRDFCCVAGAAAERIQLAISGGADELSFEYRPNAGASDDKDALKQSLLTMLRDSRKLDSKLGHTSVGVQKDDIELSVNGLSARLYASQGQQRTVALSIKMAELEFMRSVSGRSPILLLDDVFGELDLDRREQLLSAVGGCQTILTCTNADELPISDGRIEARYRVENGRAERV